MRKRDRPKLSEASLQICSRQAIWLDKGRLTRHHRLSAARLIMGESGKQDDGRENKRVIEFDMFVRDLEPDEEESLRGGTNNPDSQQPDKAKTA